MTTTKVEQLEAELEELWLRYGKYDDLMHETYKEIEKTEAELNRLDGREI